MERKVEKHNISKQRNRNFGVFVLQEKEEYHICP
jgi:hypothetical protein